MSKLYPSIDPERLVEYSVVYTDRSNAPTAVPMAMLVARLESLDTFAPVRAPSPPPMSAPIPWLFPDELQPTTNEQMRTRHRHRVFIPVSQGTSRACTG